MDKKMLVQFKDNRDNCLGKIVNSRDNENEDNDDRCDNSSGIWPKIFFIEANISAGKSTLVEKLRKIPNAIVSTEPLELWLDMVDENGVNILNNFYADTDKYSYVFQGFTFLTRIEKIKAIPRNEDIKYVFVERSIFSDKNVFAQNCYNSGLLNLIEWKIYNRWFKMANEMLGIDDYNFIYLQCPPEECLRRLKERNREEEVKVSLEYLRQLEYRHEEWFSNSEKKPVLKLDSTKNYRDNPEILDEIIQKILAFAENCK